MLSTIMNFSQARMLVHKMKLAHGNSLTYRAAVLVLLCVSNDTWDVNEIQKHTGYKKSNINTIIHNLTAAGLLVNNIIDLPDPEDEVGFMVGLSLIALVGAGKLFAHIAEATENTVTEYLHPAIIYHFPSIPK